MSQSEMSEAPQKLSETPLLHSLSIFWEQIAQALEVVKPARIVEIGSEGGFTTAKLTEWRRPTMRC